MSIGYQERDIVAWHRLATQDEKVVRPLHQKARKLVAQDLLNLVGLLDFNTQSYTVDRWFNEYMLVLIAAHREWHQYGLRRRLRLDLGDVVTLDYLRAKVFNREGRREAGSHTLQVWAKRIRLRQ